jgi:putative spermidine/putrescine transport system permease protein
VCVVNRHGWRGLAVAVVPVVVLFGGALLGALRTSLQPAPGPVFGAADLGAWRDVLADPTFHDALLFTGRLTVVATLLVLSAWGPATEDRAEAAATLGAGRVARLRFVVWPAIRAPLLLGSVIVAAYVFGAFEVPLVVGPSYPPTVATYALDATRTASLVGQARAAAALLVAAGVSLVVAVVALAGVRREL